MSLVSLGYKVFEYNGNLTIYGQVYTDRWERHGNQIHYTLNASVKVNNSSGGSFYWNYAWYAYLYVNNKLVGEGYMKPNTSGYQANNSEWFFSNHNGYGKVYGTLDVGPEGGTAEIKLDLKNIASTWETFQYSPLAWPRAVDAAPSPSITAHAITPSSTDYAKANYSATVETNDEGGEITSYTWSVDSKSYTGASGEISSLTHNKKYTYTLQATNKAGNTSTATGSFTTLHNAPTIGAVNKTFYRPEIVVDGELDYEDYYTSRLTYNTTYDNAGFGSATMQYGTSTSYGKTATGTNSGTTTTFDLNAQYDLLPNTTYYYKITHNDNGLANYKTSTTTGSFKTPCFAPSNVSTSLMRINPTWLRFWLNAEGDSNADITDLALYYKREKDANYTTVNTGVTDYWELTDLDVDTNYQVYLKATNAGGTTTSAVETYSTSLVNPTVTSLNASDITAAGCKLLVDASITPARTLNYRFSKDGGSTWTNYQASNTYQYTDLKEETEYNMKAQVKALHQGVNATDTETMSDVVLVLTLADQAKARIKKDGKYVQGKVYYKHNGKWVKAKKIYVKHNGTWVIGHND